MPHLKGEFEEPRFRADGPNRGDSPEGQSGFYTQATGLNFGVNVAGNHVGVYGESGIPDSGRNPPFPANQDYNTGVCGRGLTFGVFGDGGQVAGVYGQHESSGAGVIGVGTKTGVTGVTGASIDPLRLKESSGVGVVGATNNAKGIGVVGLSLQDFPVKDPVSIPRPFALNRDGTTQNPPRTNLGDGSGIGVMGSAGSGTGVFGSSEIGTGVYGLSTGPTGSGGKFESIQLAAQVNLVPFKQKTSTPQLPKNGMVGDLLMIRNTAQDADQNLVDRCSLWLCVPIAGRPDIDESDQWQEVMLGSPVTGTL